MREPTRSERQAFLAAIPVLGKHQLVLTDCDTVEPGYVVLCDGDNTMAIDLMGLVRAVLHGVLPCDETVMMLLGNEPYSIGIAAEKIIKTMSPEIKP